MSAIEVGDCVVETTMNGRRLEHEVLAVDQPPTNPAADPGPYVRLSDDSRGRDLYIRTADVERVDWLEHIPATATSSR